MKLSDNNELFKISETSEILITSQTSVEGKY